MIHLSLLGQQAIFDSKEERDCSAILRQPKKFAVLAYAAVTSGSQGVATRDALFATFWSEKDYAHARNSLNQTLHQLKLVIGDALTTSEDNVGIDTGLLHCDAVEFERLVRGGNDAGALAIYRGQLLPGFGLRSDVAFERWLEAQRRRLHDLAIAAAWRLVVAGEESGDAQATIRWARRYAELEPGDVGIRSLLEVLGRIGERSVATEIYHAFAERLAHDFETTPAEATTRLYEQIRGPLLDPGALTATVSVSRKINPPSSARQAERHATASSRRRDWRVAVPAFAGVVSLFVVLLFGAGIVWGDASRQSEPPRIIVEDFTDTSPDSSLSHLSNAFAEALTTRLAGVAGFDVIRSEDIHRTLPADSVLRPVFRVAGQIGRLEDDRVEVRFHLVEQVTGKHLRTGRVARSEAKVFDLLDDLSYGVAFALRARLGAEIQLREWQAGTKSPEAWQLAERATQGIERGRLILNEGRSYTGLSAIRLAEDILDRAHSLDPDWAEPLTQRARAGWVASFIFLGQGDVDSARTELRKSAAWATRALALDPKSKEALVLRATARVQEVRLSSGLAATRTQADLKAAEEDLRAALALDPGYAPAWDQIASLYQMEGRFGAAKAAREEAHRADLYLERGTSTAMNLAVLSVETGEEAEAWQWCAEAGRLSTPREQAQCEMTVMAFGDSVFAAAPERARKIVLEYGDENAFGRPYRPMLRTLYSVILARHGQRALGEAVLDSVLATLDSDPAPPDMIALAELEVGRTENARKRLNAYVRERPFLRNAISRSTRFTTLQL